MNKYYPIAEVAKIFGISKSKVYQLIENKDIGCLRIGKSIRISENDIQAFEKRNRQNKRRERPF
jgi:excisionase family DNA binding protein